MEAHVMGASIPNVLQPGAFIWFEETQGPLMKMLPVSERWPMKQLAIRVHFLRCGGLLDDCPDLTPSDFHLFLHLKSFLAGKHFNNDKELKENVSNWLKTQAATFYEEGIEKLVPRYDTCLQNFGSYVER
ncbi:histone-lysine N-methyltransferase SETMAR [Trichonephila clavipes]|nr:histone-lysine N-methyltransferase SETMAR [Trichonephila clavipes]